MARRVDQIDPYATRLGRLMGRHAEAKHIHFPAGKEGVLAAQACINLYQVLDQVGCDITMIGEWIGKAETLAESEWPEPHPTVSMKMCLMHPLDYWGAMASYAHVLRGAGLNDGVRYDNTGFPDYGDRLLQAGQSALRQIYSVFDERSSRPYIRWPDLSDCENAGRKWNDAAVQLLPSAVAAALLPLLRVS